MNELGVHVQVGQDSLSLLMYADDIVLISDKVQGTQSQLDIMTRWCNQWSMSINAKKSQIVHVRNHKKSKNKTKVFCCGQELIRMWDL